MELKVYNTLTGKKEVFKSIHKNRVGMYVCGPTVYGEPHLGHARSSITFDIVFRFLDFLGYKVRYVRNITDVGHLEDELNELGEDKIAKKARIEQLEPMEVAQHYTNLYRESMRTLNVKDPSIEPTATGHIPEQIETIQKIIENGLAYVKNESVYFDVQAFANKYRYGQLSGRVLEELQAISREDLEGSNEKNFHADFALWKKANTTHIMQWNSPWGKGFPGWHIECTAMSSKYLGVPFDIHGGGMDLKFPHHEAEICQCLGAHNTQPVNYWLHNNMVTLDGQKMAKSKGNYITLNELFTGNHTLLQRAYAPMVVRFFILQAHYGSTIDFSNESLIAAEVALKKLQQALKNSELLESKEKESKAQELEIEINKWCNKCLDSMNDDFNTAETIAALFELSRIINTLFYQESNQVLLSNSIINKLKQTFKSYLVDILGITSLDTKIEDRKLNQVMEVLIDIRNKAKINKDYEIADGIRNQLKNIGIQLMDSNEKTNFTIS
ncbi:MAG: cysteine--tRNA ligase [Solirubrobacteraceae bacterium]